MPRIQRIVRSSQEATAARQEWLRRQYATIGASSVAQALGVSPWGSPAELYDKMTGAAPPADETDDMRRGKLFEGVAVEQFAAETRLTIRRHDQNQFVYHQCGFLHALPDAWATDTASKIDNAIPIEIKCPRPITFDKMKRSRTVPEHYWIQIQMMLACTNKAMAYFVAMNALTGELFYETVERDDEFTRQALVKLRAFWDAVQNRIRPEEQEATEPEDETIRPEDLVATIPGDDGVAMATAYMEAKESAADSAENLAAAKATLLEAGVRALNPDWDPETAPVDWEKQKGEGIFFPDIMEFPGVLRVCNRETDGRVSYKGADMLKAIAALGNRIKNANKDGLSLESVIQIVTEFAEDAPKMFKGQGLPYRIFRATEKRRRGGRS